jgi:hypothetical protein
MSHCCYRVGSLKRARFVRALRAEIHRSLADHCFCLDSPPSTWVRRWGWKADMVRFTVRGDLIINYSIWVPHGPILGFEETSFGYFGLHGLVLIRGGRYSAIPFPWPMWSTTRSARRIGAQVLDGLSRLDNFDTPNRCLDYLRRACADPKSNEARAGSPFAVACERYLSSLAAELDRPACTIRQFTSWPCDGFRRLFVTPPVK